MIGGRMRRFGLPLVVALLSVGWLVAPLGSPVLAQSAPTAATPESQAVGIGQTATGGGLALTVQSVERRRQIGRFDKAGPGKVYLVIDAVVENRERDQAPYNLLYFKLRDSAGYTYTPQFVAIDNPPLFQSGTLVRGEKARGAVVFEIPESASGLVLIYEPIVLFGGYVPLRVQLS